MKRCPKCKEEIHTTTDGIELDHADGCPRNTLQWSVARIYEKNTGQHYIYHPDDPARPIHPITIGAVIDMERQIRRYEEDWQKENYQTLR